MKGVRGVRPYVWITLALVVHVIVWVAWFVFAGHHPVAEVPLAH